ncbi:hypothetical protein MKZ38_008214 [Zalerion maritima]|uniref:Ankyrin repeat protein n=1 Tax=Zalerion maritima TaxID=339359 RepID=A0AAD5RHE4_9PEZI|nr:hypothetical protein MKZ38_008214 [Zalerion maritima]
MFAAESRSEQGSIMSDMLSEDESLWEASKGKLVGMGFHDNDLDGVQEKGLKLIRELRTAGLYGSNVSGSQKEGVIKANARQSPFSGFKATNNTRTAPGSCLSRQQRPPRVTYETEDSSENEQDKPVPKHLPGLINDVIAERFPKAERVPRSESPYIVTSLPKGAPGRRQRSLLSSMSSFTSCPQRPLLTRALKIGMENVDEEMVRLLLEYDALGDFNDETKKETALHFCVGSGTPKMTGILQDYGLNTNAFDSRDQTPMISVAWDGRYNFTKYLLHKGACPLFITKKGHEALYKAAGAWTQTMDAAKAAKRPSTKPSSTSPPSSSGRFYLLAEMSVGYASKDTKPEHLKFMSLICTVMPIPQKQLIHSIVKDTDTEGLCPIHATIRNDDTRMILSLRGAGAIEPASESRRQVVKREWPPENLAYFDKVGMTTWFEDRGMDAAEEDKRRLVGAAAEVGLESAYRRC